MSAPRGSCPSHVKYGNFYPGTGHNKECGVGAGLGFTVNCGFSADGKLLSFSLNLISRHERH